MNRELCLKTDSSPYLDTLAFLNGDLYKKLTFLLLRFLGDVQYPFPLQIAKHKDMENFYFIGVDVSKKKLDFCVLLNGTIVLEEVVNNNIPSIRRFLETFLVDFKTSIDNLLVCAEHTGQYTFPLSIACQSLSCGLWLENPARIKYSSGFSRGKNDKVDAHRIARYASRFSDNARYYQRPREEIERLKQLRNEQDLYKSDLAKYKGQLSEQREFMLDRVYQEKAQRLERLIEELEKLIKDIDLLVETIIRSCRVLWRQRELLLSVEGVGPSVALCLIIETEAFTRFDDPRKFACHAGVAPFRYTSGSSQHSRNKVSQRANKQIKTLLHMAALSITGTKSGELKAYYERKVKEGKNKMTVINAIRAKLIARMFAVIKKDQFYTPVYS